jgi:homoserine dehydrogenase
MEYRLALVGFGTVGQGLAEILRDHGPRLLEEFGVSYRITGVSDVRLGSVHDPAGFEPEALLAATRSDRGLAMLEARDEGWDAVQLAEAGEADVLVELSYTDLATGEPATSHVRSALESGKHVVTTNKGPVALHWAELSALAAERGVEIGVEGTVMSGTPTMNLGRNLLRGAGIRAVRGILNGTCNYILTRMEAGSTYDEALAEAQERGYAEADPTGDVEGYDAAGKVVILANVLMGVPLRMAEVDRTGISGLTPDDVAEAAAEGARWKLVGSLETVGGPSAGVTARVAPERVPLSHPLAGVGGAVNAVTFTTELLGDVTLVGPGAGRLETGYSVLVDLLEIHRTTALRG